ncbi:MAG: HelD family protein [Acidimicrobiales bacterium]
MTRPDDGDALAIEQAMLDRAHGLLEAMQARADEVRAVADRAVRDENTADARVAQWKMQQRQAALTAGAGPLAFGRIADGDDEWVVGRRHVEAADGAPFVVDWRAPIAAPFYRATAVDPCGLEFRRRLSVEGREVVAVADEDLTDPDGEVRGGLPDPLLAELDRERTGRMGDIVATIAGEQDVVIRAELDRLVVVQGGPGTGKTAVGLHRAAFLLFAERERFMDQNVLVIGPNRGFLRYIADVLPSLGETSVSQNTLSGLMAARYRLATERDRPADADEVAHVKGDPRMAGVIANLVAASRKVPDELELRSGVAKIRLAGADVDALMKTALARDLPSNAGREVFRQLLAQEAWRRQRERPGVDPASQPDFVRGITSDAQFAKDLNSMWPTLSGANLVRDLFRSKTKRRRACAGLFADDEADLLARSVAKKLADERWSPAEIPLVDEAVAQAQGVAASYAHIVVDEAQDHSPMALRMLGRRARGHSMTILGDLAQATAVQAVDDWSVAVEHLGVDRDATTVEIDELTVGYRVPAPVLDLANRLVPVAAPTVTPARSVRPSAVEPLVVEASADERTSLVLAEVEALAERMTSVGVVAPDEDLAVLGAALAELDLGDTVLQVLDADAVKGLEFDAVVVVEPEGIVADVADRARGLRRLYVALTRAVQHLGIVHTQPLPPELAP